MVYDYPVYLPKKRIKFRFGFGKDRPFKWTAKKVGFKSLGTLVNYRTFRDNKYDEDCFIFGLNITDENQQYKQANAPYAVLEGYSCRNTGTFTNEEIKIIINNIGIKKIRNL